MTVTFVAERSARPPRLSLFLPVALWAWHTMGAQILRPELIYGLGAARELNIQSRKEKAISIVRPGCCNERKCESMCIAGDASPQSAWHGAKLQDPRCPFLRALAGTGGGRRA